MNKTLLEERQNSSSVPRYTEEDPPDSTERVHAISGLEVKQSLPVIKDTDPDLEKHIREFQSIMDCQAVGRKGVRPYDVLLVFRKTLAPGSTRLKVYETEVRRALKAKRLPGDAKAVLDEILTKLRRVIRETAMQKKERVEREFDLLVMGKLSHSTFRAEWEYCLEELEDAGVDLPSKDSLYRTYLRKISAELRSAVLRQTWALDRVGPPRKPATWEEVADCVEMELETRVDACAPREGFHALGEGVATGDRVAFAEPGAIPDPPFPSGATRPGRDRDPGLEVCCFCARPGHPSGLCPRRAAELRHEVEKCTADFERGGTVCTLCYMPDHREEHHSLAAMDYAATAGPVASAVGLVDPTGLKEPPPASRAGAGSPTAQPQLHQSQLPPSQQPQLPPPLQQHQQPQSQQPPQDRPPPSEIPCRWGLTCKRLL